MREDPDLGRFVGRVADSGEGRWTSIAAIDEGVPANILTLALYERFSSRGEADFAGRNRPTQPPPGASFSVSLSLEETSWV
jgi:6-phosphogluconate dehydrogenase (decarboxylating)